MQRIGSCISLPTTSLDAILQPVHVSTRTQDLLAMMTQFWLIERRFFLDQMCKASMSLSLSRDLTSLLSSLKLSYRTRHQDSMGNQIPMPRYRPPYTS